MKKAWIIIFLGVVVYALSVWFFGTGEDKTDYDFREIQKYGQYFQDATNTCESFKSKSQCQELIKFQVSPILFNRTDTPYRSTVKEYASAIGTGKLNDENRIDDLVAYTYESASKYDIELSQRYTEKWPMPDKE